MKKKIFAIIILTTILLGLMTLIWNYFEEKAPAVYIKEKKFKIEIAETAREKALGLGGRDSLCRKCAMLFIFFEKGRYSFWMKEMLFPLDIIWFDSSDGKIRHIEKNVPADFKGALNPPSEVDRVLEISGGLADEYGIQMGDEVYFEK